MPSLRIVALALLAVCIGRPSIAQTDAYPSKPIRMVVCCAGFPDAVARVLAEQMGEQDKVSIIVDTRPGANGIVGAQIVAQAPADGYTMFIGTNSTHAANQSLYKSLPYDYVKDFTPVSGVSQGALMAAVNPELPVHSIAELTALARKEPDKLNYGWASSSTRIAVELYKQIEDIKITDVPYKTLPQATTDLMSGRLDFMIGDMVSVPPLVAAGKLRALAVSGATRMPSYPDLPTMEQAGVPGYALTFWLAAYLPAGAPPAVTAKLNAMVTKALVSPRVKDFLLKTGSQPFPTTPDELMRFQVAEHDKWRKVIQGAGIQPE
jgi:tripartite-type tricarboxylate transporter receptor subunit TctC